MNDIETLNEKVNILERIVSVVSECPNCANCKMLTTQYLHNKDAFEEMATTATSKPS
jgi:hypothetical protein